MSIEDALRVKYDSLEIACRKLLGTEYAEALVQSALGLNIIGSKYHPVQPRSGGRWVTPSGENHPLMAGRLEAAESDHFADVRYTTYKEFDVGSGVTVAMPDQQAIATGYKDANSGELVLLRLAVDPGLQRKGVGSAMLAELGNVARGNVWKYGTMSQTSERGQSFMSGLQRRGLASPRENSSAAWWLHADALAAKYARTEVSG